MNIFFLGVPVSHPPKKDSALSLTEVVGLLSNVRIEDLLSQSMAEHHATADLDGKPDKFNPSDGPDTASMSLPDIDVSGPAPSGEAPSLCSIQGNKGKEGHDKRRHQNQW
jgi:hypothetical protein